MITLELNRKNNAKIPSNNIFFSFPIFIFDYAIIKHQIGDKHRSKTINKYNAEKIDKSKYFTVYQKTKKILKKIKKLQFQCIMRNFPCICIFHVIVCVYMLYAWENGVSWKFFITFPFAFILYFSPIRIFSFGKSILFLNILWCICICVYIFVFLPNAYLKCE